MTDKLEKEEKDKLRQLADKDREKVQATGKYLWFSMEDLLKKDMLHRI